MPETTPEQEAYDKYVVQVGNTPVDPKVAKREQDVLANAQSRGYEPFSHEDPTRDDYINGLPEGEFYKTDMTEPELELAIKDLTEARETLTKFLEHSTAPEVKYPKETTLFEFEENIEKFPPNIAKAFSDVVKYLDPESNMALFDLPVFIKENLTRYQIILEHNKKKQLNK